MECQPPSVDREFNRESPCTHGENRKRNIQCRVDGRKELYEVTGREFLIMETLKDKPYFEIAKERMYKVLDQTSLFTKGIDKSEN